MRLCLAIVALFLAALPARAENEVLAGLSQHSVSLTTGFSGSELFVYGGFWTQDDDEAPFDVIVTVTGPEEPVTVRRKERRFGIWVNGRGVRINAAPSFYAVASTGTFEETVGPADDLKYQIGLNKIIKLVDAPLWVDNQEAYREAVARIREDQGLYAFLPGTVTVRDNRIFETRIRLPANLVEGDYIARVFLIRDLHVQDVYEDTIEVRRTGLGRLVYSSAQNYPTLYGLASIFVALFAGWLASAFFRTFFPT